jgi:uncharacterized membrane protein (UPF0127 family)
MYVTRSAASPASFAFRSFSCSQIIESEILWVEIISDYCNFIPSIISITMLGSVFQQIARFNFSWKMPISRMQQSPEVGKRSRLLFVQIIVIVVILLASISIVYFISNSQNTELSGCTPNSILSSVNSSTNLLAGFSVTCLSIKNSINGSTILDGDVYVANTEAQQQQGFMNVTSFGNCNGAAVNGVSCIGMLFNFSSSQELCFWMRDTEIPLEQDWITTNGTITTVYQAQAENNTSVCYYGNYVLETSPQEPVVSGYVVEFG